MDEPEFLVHGETHDHQTIYTNVEVYTDTDGNFCEYTSNVEEGLDVDNTDGILESNSRISSNLFESKQDIYVKLELPDHQENDNGTTDDESMAVEALRQLGNSTYSNHETTQIKTPTSLDIPLLPCPICNSEFTSTAELNAHEEICQESQFTCPICCESFERKSELNNHLVCHAVDRPHACRICGSLFVHKKDLQQHMQTHGENSQNQCQICGLQFNRPSSLTNHLKIHAYQPGRGIPHDILNDELSSEPVQKITLPSIHNITMHNWNLSFEPDNFQSDINLEVAQDVTINALHDTEIGLVEANIKLETNTKPHACTLCPKRFAREKALLSHLKLHKTVFDRIFNCDRCNQNFSKQSLLDKHAFSCNIQNVTVTVSSTSKKNDIKPAKKIVQNHVNKSECNENLTKPVLPTALPDVENPSYDVNVYNKIYKHSCQICGKHFTTKQKLFRHVWIHRKKMYTCEVCDKQFEVQHLLDSHRLANHQSGSPYFCPECGKNFSTRQGLWEHNRIHTVDINSFKCDECSKTFTSRQGFLIHQRKHKGERPYGCRFCWKAFRDGGTLRKHERIHTGERPHACPLCSKAFNQKVVLREHIRMLHTSHMEPNSEGQYVCKICAVKISDKDELCVHIVKHSDQMAQLAKDASRNNIPTPDEPPRKRAKRTPKVEVLQMEQHIEDENVDNGLQTFDELNGDNIIIDHKIEILEESIVNDIEFTEVEGQIDNVPTNIIQTDVVTNLEGTCVSKSSVDNIIDKNLSILVRNADEQKANLSGNNDNILFNSVICDSCGAVLTTELEFNEHITMHI